MSKTAEKATVNENGIPVLLTEKKGLIKCIIFSVITLGIYYLVWLHSVVKKIKLLNGDEGGCAGEMLLIMFIPFYAFHWAKTRGRKLSQAADKYHIYVSDNGGLYLFLCFFISFGISTLMMQSDLNNIAGILSFVPQAEPEPELEQTESEYTFAVPDMPDVMSGSPDEPAAVLTPDAEVISDISDEPIVHETPVYVARKIAAPVRRTGNIYGSVAPEGTASIVTQQQ